LFEQAAASREGGPGVPGVAMTITPHRITRKLPYVPSTPHPFPFLPRTPPLSYLIHPSSGLQSFQSPPSRPRVANVSEDKRLAELCFSMNLLELAIPFVERYGARSKWSLKSMLRVDGSFRRVFVLIITLPRMWSVRLFESQYRNVIMSTALSNILN